MKTFMRGQCLLSSAGHTAHKLHIGWKVKAKDMRPFVSIRWRHKVGEMTNIVFVKTKHEAVKILNCLDRRSTNE